MEPRLAELDRALRQRLRQAGRVLVAYSGGVDSALVLAVAHAELGKDALGVIGVSPSLDPEELAAARATAKAIGAAVRELPTDEFANEDYASNPVNRCYFCKAELHTKLKQLSVAEKFSLVADGFHLDDLGDVRPGHQAGVERGVSSPLAEAGFRKADVRALALAMNIPAWDKPAAPCLSSRVAFGLRVTPQIVGRIGAAERLVRNALPQVRDLRVRLLRGEEARLEVDAELVGRLEALRAELTPELLALGFRTVTIAPEGYRRGGANLKTAVAA